MRHHAPIDGRGLPRAALLVEVDGEVLVVNFDGSTTQLAVELSHERDEDWASLLVDPRPFRSSLSSVRAELHATSTSGPLYVMRRLEGWPEITTADLRCPSEVEPEPGVVVRCQRWRGHEAALPGHTAGPLAWTDAQSRQRLV